MKSLAHLPHFSFRSFLLLAGIAILAPACDVLDEEEVDCSVDYRVKFKYDMNMKFADAFAHEVKSVTLYAFDTNGKFMFQKTEQGEMLAEDNYSMKLDVEPGDYDLVTWAGLEGEESFDVPILRPGESTLDDLNCRMNRQYQLRSGDNEAYVDKDLKPLFHGRVARHSFSRAHRDEFVTIPLTKNTNNVRVVLQHLNGSPVDVSKFTFTIEDDNGLMDHTNRVLDDEDLTYYPWHIDQGTAEMHPDGSRAQESVSVAIAELTVSRLVMQNRPILRIHNEKGEKVLSIPLIDYALLVKGNYHRQMSDQEYLDRQDEYNLTFFLDEDNHWFSSMIYINSWKVVLDHVEL